MLCEPLHPSDAKRLIRQILKMEQVSVTGHAERAMADDSLTMVDCVNVLDGGVVDPAEWENGSWRYRVRTARICFVIAFRSTTRLAIVTAWRF